MIVYGKDLVGPEKARIPGSNVWAYPDGKIVSIEGNVVFDPGVFSRRLHPQSKLRVNFLIGDRAVEMNVSMLIMFSFMGKAPDTAKTSNGQGRHSYEGSSIVVQHVNGDQDDVRLENLVMTRPNSMLNEDNLVPTIAVPWELMVGIVKYNQLMEDKIKNTGRVIRPFDMYATHYDVVKGFISKMIGNTKSQEIIEDITSEAFMKAERKFDQFDPEKASLFTWICQIAKNDTLQFLRKDKKLPTMSIDASQSVAVQADKTLVEKTFDTYIGKVKYEQERLEVLRESLPLLMSQLDEKNKMLCELRLSGLSYQEICDKTDMPMTTVKTRIGRIIQKGREVLVSQGLMKSKMSSRKKNKYNDPRMTEITDYIIDLRTANVSVQKIVMMVKNKFGFDITPSKVRLLLEEK